MEQCDSVQGLVMHSSLVGGSGSGLMTLLLERLGYNYGKKLKIINNVLYASNK
jgi:Tubulin/FtsZ family, GTPase domain